MHKTKIDTCVHTYKSHYKDGGEVFIDYDYANNTQVIVLPNGSKEPMNNEELACLLEELKKEKTPKGYNLALINFAIAEVKDKKMKGGILETPELDGNFYYIGFFDKKNHQLKSTARITQADVNSTKYRDVVFNAIDKGLYIKFIDKSYYTNFSPLDKPITEQEIYKPGGQIPNHMNITQEAIAKGAKHELEHAATIQKIKDNPGMSKEEAARLIALDHLKEDPNYYEQPHFNEPSEMEQGGTTHSTAPAEPNAATAPHEPKYAPFQIVTNNAEAHAKHSIDHASKRSYYIITKPATPFESYNPALNSEVFDDYGYYAWGFVGSLGGESIGNFYIREKELIPYYPTAEELTAVIDKCLTYKNSAFFTVSGYDEIIKYMQEYRQKIEAGYSIYNDPEITTIIISSAAPLWSQLTALLGYGQADFDQVITAQRNNWSQPLIQQNTGEKFAVITLEDAKKAGILGMQIPSEGAVHNFFEMVNEQGEHAAIAHYKEKFLLTDEVISNLLNGYATGATYKQEYELLKNIAQKFYRIKHPKKYAQGGDMKEEIKETRLDDNTLLEEKGDTKVLTLRSGMYKGIYTITADGEVSDEDGPVKEKIKEYIMSKIENLPAPGEKPLLTGKAVITSWQAVPDAWKVVKKIPKVPYTNSPFDKGLQTILEPFVGTDELRPAMTSFNFDENGITATDAHKMLILPYPNKKFNGAYCVTKLCKQANSSVKKDKLQGKYPDYAAVISKENPIVHKVSVYKLKTFVKAILMGKYANEVTQQVRLVYNKEQGAYDHIGFKGQFLLEVLETFLKLGFEYVFMSFSMPNRAVAFSPAQAAAQKPHEYVGKEILAILMPIMIDGNYGSYRGGYHAEGESVTPHMQSAAMDLDWGKEFAVSYNLIDDEIYNHDGTIAPFDYNLTTAVNKDMTDLQETILRAYLPKNPKVLVTEYVKVDSNQLTATDETATIQLNIAAKPKGLYSFLAGALDFLPESPAEATIRNASIDDFPEVGYGKTRGFKNIGSINRAEFVFHLQKAILNLGKDDLRPALKGLHFVKTKDALIIEASNSNTLYHAVINNEDIKPCDFIISEPAKLLVFLKNVADTNISVSISGTEVSFIADSGIATHMFIDATFPSLISKVNLTKKLSIDIGELKECLKTITKDEANPPVLVFNHISEATPIKMDVDLYNGFHFNKGQPSHVRHLCKVSANYEAVENKLTATYFLGMPFTAGDKTKTYFGLSKQVIETFIKTSESDILNLHFNEYNQPIVLTDTDIEYAEEVINAPKTKKAKKSAPVIQETAPVKPKAEVNTERKALETLLSLTTNAHEKELIEAEIKKHTA